MKRDVIPARQGKAVRLDARQHIKVVNTYGQQVLDTWAFRAHDVGEYLSMEHTRSRNSTIYVQEGATLVSTRRRPMLTLVEDRSPGNHDTLLCACSAEIYQELGCTEYHRNCEDNLHAALAELGLEIPCTPAPLNLFMNTPALADGRIDRRPPAAAAGDYVILRAEMDLILVFSACPQDVTVINGLDRPPRDAAYVVT
ncbi:MAG: urea carboxylase-associated family protein [Geminicoccaceae bacterium]|nr:MAG: urea carboxylase-associated family protein [Geminicoccaceae bacterium]